MRLASMSKIPPQRAKAIYKTFVVIYRNYHVVVFCGKNNILLGNSNRCLPLLFSNRILKKGISFILYNFRS